MKRVLETWDVEGALQNKNRKRKKATGKVAF